MGRWSRESHRGSAGGIQQPARDWQRGMNCCASFADEGPVGEAGRWGFPWGASQDCSRRHGDGSAAPERSSRACSQVAHKLVHIALARDLADDVLVVVIPQSAAQLLVVHAWLVLPRTPLASHLFWVVQLKLPLSPGPHDAVLVLSVR